MGLNRLIEFPTDSRPTWESVRIAFQSVSENPVVRMIDNLPAFPDEIPEPGWRELRLALSGGMVTLRAAPNAWECIVWGNADAALLRSRDVACWAIASAGQGSIVLEDGTSASAGAFRESLRGG